METTLAMINILFFIFSDTNTISKKPQPDSLAMEPLKSLAGNVTKLPNVLPSKLDGKINKKKCFLKRIENCISKKLNNMKFT